MLFPRYYLNSIVAIGIHGPDGFKPVGTGFLYKSIRGQETVPVVVTNRHVMDQTSRGQPAYRFDRWDQGGRIGRGEEVGAQPWIPHPDPAVDLAVGLSASALSPQYSGSYSYLRSTNAVRRENNPTHSLGEGDGVFVFGFPLGLVGERSNNVIVRHGILSRVQGWLRGDEQDFLIDCSAFPGNSGGPVVLRPESFSRDGSTISQTAPHSRGRI